MEETDGREGEEDNETKSKAIQVDEVGERQVEVPELIQQIVDKVELIKKRIKTAHNKHASYGNTKRKPLHFETGEHVFLQVSPFRKVMRFWSQEKASTEIHLSILEKVEDMAYRLALPPLLSEVQLKPNFSYVERPDRIIDRKDKVLRNMGIPLVMIQWQRRGTEEATWELEIRMRSEQPELF
ncbi:uncharacterized protein [Henckelia pumila]|uniref:uncharacterized protein n=1 Tax=Henckelia pumila TaxID=405737 RepID=UPI003C6E03E4